MNIGLLTYQKSYNNGAILQAYATQRALRELGHQVEFVNVYTERHGLLHKFFYYPKDRITANFYKKFYPSESSFYATMDDLRNTEMKYECLVVGSDQTWNPQICQEKLMAFFLDFGDDKMKRISYASSIGLSDWPKDVYYLIPEISAALHKFKGISVREETAQRILKEKFGIDDAQIVVDPTLLHKDYHEITGDIFPTGDIVCYLLGRLPFQLEVAKTIGKVKRKKPRMTSNLYPLLGFKYTYPPSVAEWIRLIGGAGMIITDSFHGLVFSLLYRRDFIVLGLPNGRMSRLTDLLKMVGLSERFFTSLEDFQNRWLSLTPIDYDAVHEKIEDKRKTSWNFLKENLE